ncbi:MAG: hypothetical protein GEV28_24280 [Actinophytocola sp.]|uniref:hypothetical protein n=1 Tax=Actinophytocola sp. TaxID=1872138 RepID=UPI001329692D|nr:hypothetical protein [Actinophytocola sp.]MPZ83340.1 hypothetical protein [Actinophytocola sp.]
MSGVTAVVDFGTTETVVVLRAPGRAPRVVAGEPTAVLLSAEDQVVVGREAVRRSIERPDRLVSDLKARVGEREVLVGGVVLPIPALVRALFVRVLRSVGPLDELVLTHPVGWDSARVEVLTRAAAGFAPSVRTAPEPLAAAADADIEPERTVLVAVLDGDTGTAAAVRRSSAGLEVVSHSELAADSDVRKVVAAARADRVLVVGGSADVSKLARRVAETGAPVRVAPEPATAVARGALRLIDEVPVPVPTAPSAGRPVLRRALVTAAGLVIVAAVGAMLVLGWGPGLQMAGSPAPAAGALVDEPAPDSSGSSGAMPPVVEGREMVGAGQPAFTAGRLDNLIRWKHTSGTTLEVRVDEVRAERSGPLGEAPAGYRWLTVLLSGSNVNGPAWKGEFSRYVAALDDRGLLLRTVGDGVVPCGSGGATPAAGSVPPGDPFTVCVTMPVPERTPVSAVVFGTFGSEAGAQAPIRFPVSVPAVNGAKPTTARVVGKLGAPPVEVEVAGETMRAGFDLVLTPSGYLADRRPAAGSRFVVVRAALGPANQVYLRDDRGALSRPVSGYDTMPNCPPFTGPGTAERPVYACFVYEVDADAVVTGVTYGALPADDKLSGEDMERWPTWTVR